MSYEYYGGDLDNISMPVTQLRGLVDDVVRCAIAPSGSNPLQIITNPKVSLSGDSLVVNGVVYSPHEGTSFIVSTSEAGEGVAVEALCKGCTITFYTE